MNECKKINVKLWDLPLNKLKFAAKSQRGVTLRTNIKMFDGDELPHDLLLTTSLKKIRLAFNNNMGTDIKLSKAQISKITQSGSYSVRCIIQQNSWSIYESSNSVSKRYFSTIRRDGSSISNRCRNSKKKKERKNTNLN